MRAGNTGNGWWGYWVLMEMWRRRSMLAERSGGSASAWPREGSVHTVDPRRKSASSRSNAMTYEEEGRWRGWEERGRDGVGRGVD
jgi:hypothetical protein